MAKKTQEKRQRVRIDSLKIDKEKIFARVKQFYDTDLTSHDVDRDIRLQRYAKLRMWVEGKDWPWDNCSDLPLSDILEKSLRMQDTLHNAVMSARPVITSTATIKADTDKQEMVDNLIDWQIFEEHPGEVMVGEAADAFVNDGVLTLFIPWVKESREVTDIRIFNPIPEQMQPGEYFNLIIKENMKPVAARPSSNGGWDWKVKILVDGKNQDVDVKFYTQTETGRVEMVSRQVAVTFDGPKPIVMDYEDVLHPVRATNLKIPGPSNPGGADHVILRDYPSIDEIKRLAKRDFYDLITKEQIEELENWSRDMTYDTEEDQRDDLAGKHVEPGKNSKAKSHNKLTRLTVFDTFDINNDGVDEDVIWWVLLEPKIILKAKYLTEMYPGIPPMRPFAEASFVPVRGRRTGVSQTELLEGLHDAKKALLDQGIDAGTLSNSPFYFYRAVAGTRPEVIRLFPGEGYPVADPKRDIHFPTIGNPQAQGFMINMVTMMEQMEERVAVIGDAQFGRVPAGKSAALRTTGNMQMLMGQGEARPERILRRFFLAFAEMWKIIHQMNQHFLPDNKKFRLFGDLPKSEDAYQEVTKRDIIRANFNFSFSANVFNTSKTSLQQSLGLMLQTYMNEFNIQTGILQPDGAYRLQRDFGKSYGIDVNKYITQPTANANMPRILAEEAIAIMLRSEVPEGLPLEPGGIQEHMQKLFDFASSDQFGLLTESAVQIFGRYVQGLKQLLEQERQRAQLAEAAANQQGPEGQPGRPTENAPASLENPQVSGGGELIDESLPTAGGGGNTGGG